MPFTILQNLERIHVYYNSEIRIGGKHDLFVGSYSLLEIILSNMLAEFDAT